MISWVFEIIWRICNSEDNARYNTMSFCNRKMSYITTSQSSMNNIYHTSHCKWNDQVACCNLDLTYSSNKFKQICFSLDLRFIIFVCDNFVSTAQLHDKRNTYLVCWEGFQGEAFPIKTQMLKEQNNWSETSFASQIKHASTLSGICHVLH